VACVSVLLLFQIVQTLAKFNAPYLWLELKVFNNLIMSALTGSIIMFQYPLSLIMLYPMIVISFTSCLRPIPSAYDFTYANYSRSVLQTLLWLTFSLGGATLLVFGTLLDQARWNPAKVKAAMTEVLQTTILDYECANSRTWVVLAAICVPNALILAKILTN